MAMQPSLPTIDKHTTLHKGGMGRRWLKLLPKHEYFSESPNRTSKSTIACKLNARIQIVEGPPVTVAP